jgi:hypothetical protein
MNPASMFFEISSAVNNALSRRNELVMDIQFLQRSLQLH